jgi:signal transduction histidine kinase/FixJ family two-component response regulator
MSSHVLIVDDDSDLVELYQEVLREKGHRVDSVSTGKAAMIAVQQTDFDVVIMDLNLPDADGLILTANVKAVASRTEVIIVTGNASVEKAVEGVRQGAFDFLEKPIRPQVLIRAVGHALERRKLAIDSALFQTSQAIFASQDPEELPQMIVEVAMKVIGADDASLMLPDDHKILCVAYSHALSARIQKETRTAMGERVAGRVAADGRPALLSERLADDPRFAGTDASKRVRSSIVYPMRAGDRVVGVLNLNRLSTQIPFRQSDLETAGILASQATLALENARLVRELKCRIRALEEAQSRLVHTERLAAIGQLAAGVAHEVNNPTSYLIASLDHLLSSFTELRKCSGAFESPETYAALKSWHQGETTLSAFLEMEQCISDARDGATRIRDIAKDLRLLSRSDDPEGSRVDLNSVMRGAARVAQLSMGKSVTLRSELNKDVWVYGLERRLSQIFVNLLVNAAQAVMENPPENRWVEIRSFRNGEQVVAEIADNGPGIAPELLRRIFEPFFTTKSGEEGTGLGLAISREIVEKHQGELVVESVLGQGTVFRITLPFSPEHQAK